MRGEPSGPNDTAGSFADLIQLRTVCQGRRPTRACRLPPWLPHSRCVRWPCRRVDVAFPKYPAFPELDGREVAATREIRDSLRSAAPTDQRWSPTQLPRAHAWTRVSRAWPAA